MAVKVSWTSWAMACTAGSLGLGIQERSQGNTAKLQKTQICVCGSAGTKHKAPEMEGRSLPPARLMLLVLQCSPMVSWESIYLQKQCSSIDHLSFQRCSFSCLQYIGLVLAVECCPVPDRRERNHPSWNWVQFLCCMYEHREHLYHAKSTQTMLSVALRHYVYK